VTPFTEVVLKPLIVPLSGCRVVMCKLNTGRWRISPVIQSPFSRTKVCFEYPSLVSSRPKSRRWLSWLRDIPANEPLASQKISKTFLSVYTSAQDRTQYATDGFFLLGTGEHTTSMCTHKDRSRIIASVNMRSEPLLAVRYESQVYTAILSEQLSREERELKYTGEPHARVVLHVVCFSPGESLCFCQS
jgi:hypothetical protein